MGAKCAEIIRNNTLFYGKHLFFKENATFLKENTLAFWYPHLRYNTGEIIVMDQVQKYMDGPRLLRMRLSGYIPQLSTRNVDLVP